MHGPLELWRVVFQDGIAPQLSDAELLALRRGLRLRDPKICQGHTTQPSSRDDWLDNSPVSAACAIGYAAWKGGGLVTVSQVQARFQKIVGGCDEVYGKADYTIQAFCKFFDYENRDLVMRELLVEVEAAIVARGIDELCVSVPAILSAVEAHAC